MKRKRLTIAAAALIGAALAQIVASASPSAATPFAHRRMIGTTFSHVELAARGLDASRAFDDMNDLGFRVIRMGAYWTEIEPKEGAQELAKLDGFLARAEARGQSVLLTVGMKAPRWPEYYIPAWAQPSGAFADKNSEVSRDPVLRARALGFIARTVRALAHHRSIIAWQVENEPMDRSGEHRWFLGADYVWEAARAIRANDPRRRPLVVNVWCDDQTYSSFPWTDARYAEQNALDLGDVLGLDVYPRVGAEQFFYARRTIALPKKYRAEAQKDGKDAWIIESQAEPWPPSGYDAAAMRWLTDRHSEQGYRVVMLWGFEYWYEQRVRHGDSSMWDAAREIAARLQAKP